MPIALIARHRPFVVATLLVVLIAGLTVYAWAVDHAAWETDVVRMVQESEIPGLRPVSIFLAVAGTGLPWAIAVGAIGLALLLLNGVRIALLLLVTALLQDVGAGMKLLIERSRPAEGSVEVWRQVSSYSFPSGHVLGATLVFGFLVIALEHTALDIRLRRGIQAACLAWIVLMGLGRMVVGAHWPTDVLGGYLVGALLLLPIAALVRRSTPTPAGSSG